jgi:outer membrane receptor for ferrienterochelin and colicins
MRFIIFFISLTWLHAIDAQNLSGNVLDQQQKGIQGVVVTWMGTAIGTTTNENGFFRIPRQSEHRFLVLSLVGYNRDTFEIPENEIFSIINLTEGIQLKAVEVEGSRNSNTFSRINTLNVEGLEKKEFKKAACCSLSESFQTSNAVDLSYTNAATGTKEIQFLGLRGLYTQLLLENRPAFSGILSTMGYELIPGTWLDRVDIQKGASTTMYGAQSMAGAINVQLKKPHDDFPVYANLFGDFHGRMEANLHLNKKWSEKNASGIYINGTIHDAVNDHNGDSFQDDARVNRINGLIRNTFFSNTWEGQLNVQGTYEKRNSGQLINESPYKINQEISHFNLFGNLGYVNFKQELQNTGSIYDLSYSKINSFFGTNKYDAEEKRVFFQIFYNQPFKDGMHQFMMGPSFKYNEAEEIYRSDTIQYKETVLGAFMDYSFRNNLHLDNSFSLTISQRLDVVNGDRALYMPRINARFLFADDWTLRASAGRGYRFARLYSDHTALFATSKSWNIQTPPEIETSWNTGLNVVGKPYLNGKELTINVDAYYTWFSDQLIVDLDEDYSTIHVYNLKGRSFAFQTIATIAYPVHDRINVKIGGKYTDSQSEFMSGMRQNLLVPKYRGLVSLDFESGNKKWLWNVTSVYVGKMRLADKVNVPHEFIHNHEGYSDDYILMQTQLNFTHKAWEFYTGIENILNYTQHNAIIDANNPTGIYFNAAEVYAPVSGIKPYIGIKWKLIK